MSRCVSVLETLLSRTLRHGGAQFCQMRSIETPLWNSVRCAIKTNRITQKSVLDLVQTLIDSCHISRAPSSCSSLFENFNAKTESKRVIKLLESLLDDETFYASSNMIENALAKCFKTSSLSTLQFGCKLLIRIIKRFGLWNSHLNMLNLLMYQREFHKIALECVLTIVSHDPTMPSPQDYSINSETQLQMRCKNFIWNSQKRSVRHMTYDMITQMQHSFKKQIV